MREGLALGPTAVLVGIAPLGGRLPPEWRGWLAEALDGGCDLWSGLHTFLSDDPLLVAKAKAAGKKILDSAPSTHRPSRGLGRRQDGGALRRSHRGNGLQCRQDDGQLQLARELNAGGLRTRFVPTGQTGIMIEGWGIAVDAVISDFVAGAAERLVLQGAEGADVVLVEGQGSINHPGYSAVTLGLLHGSCPDGLILCHQSSRQIHRRLSRGRLAQDSRR